MAETPKVNFELRKSVNTQIVHARICEALGLDEKEIRTKLLVIWKGTESARCATLTFQQDKGWVGQFDAMVGWLQRLEGAQGYDKELEVKLNEAIAQEVHEHGDYRLPMLLVVWEPGDSIIFKHYWLNSTHVWRAQVDSFTFHMRDLLTYTRQNTWAQAEYNNAVAAQREQQIHGGKKLILPR